MVATFFFMEFVAWFAHKYVMHGFLWSWHADHHLPKYQKEGFFEKNDRFFLVFAIPSAACYFIGSMFGVTPVLFIGIGISIYGLAYFLVHDVFIHKRFKWFRDSSHWYAKAITRAHGAHHAKTTKEDCESFGMLIVNPKYYGEKKKKAREEAERL